MLFIMPGTKSCPLRVELLQLAHCALFISYFIDSDIETAEVTISSLIR